ncbi:YpoC family protein [Sporosarcina sp. FSL K6-2383]|uniref:YpoC family protein n=1 Tax=Sporosarcina sp. FSL K6-2383 TaxID=2921556 RepID=UPI00315AA3A0
MPSDKNQFDKELFTPYFEQWQLVRGEIEAFYNQKDSRAVELMKIACQSYCELLELGGTAYDDRKEKAVFVLLPLNGEERFEFIKAKIASHYAFVQLDALMIETKKKVARLAIRKK